MKPIRIVERKRGPYWYYEREGGPLWPVVVLAAVVTALVFCSLYLAGRTS